MKQLRSWAAALVAVFVFTGQAMAATFVYVSNADEGDIGLYLMRADGSLQPGARYKAEKVVMPMAVSRDKRFLVAAVRSKPYAAYTYSIHRQSGALQLVSTGPLAESFPYISFDRTSRWLFGASYGANLVSVNPVSTEGRIGEPAQVIPTARNAHAIHPDRTNRFVFVPHLGPAGLAAQGRHRATAPAVLRGQPVRIFAERAERNRHDPRPGQDRVPE
jgi:6-phosphogluconolactonase